MTYQELLRELRFLVAEIYYEENKENRVYDKSLADKLKELAIKIEENY